MTLKKLTLLWMLEEKKNRKKRKIGRKEKAEERKLNWPQKTKDKEK